MCFSSVQVERRRAVGGVETVESNKMDDWNFKCSRVIIHVFAFFSLGMLPLNFWKNLLSLVVVNLIL